MSPKFSSQNIMDPSENLCLKLRENPGYFQQLKNEKKPCGIRV